MAFSQILAEFTEKKCHWPKICRLSLSPAEYTKKIRLEVRALHGPGGPDRAEL